LNHHFVILTLAYILLCPFGAVAESAGLGEQFKATTVAKRGISLAQIGNYFLQTAQVAITYAIDELLDLATWIKTGY